MGLVSHIPSIMIRTITHVPDNELRGRKMEQTQSSESLVNPPCLCLPAGKTRSRPWKWQRYSLTKCHCFGEKEWVLGVVCRPALSVGQLHNYCEARARYCFLASVTKIQLGQLCIPPRRVFHLVLLLNSSTDDVTWLLRFCLRSRGFLCEAKVRVSTNNLTFIAPIRLSTCAPTGKIN
jgi:hypothetical protein